MEDAMGTGWYVQNAQDVLFVLGVLCAMALGGVAGVYCAWGFILVYSVVLIVATLIIWGVAGLSRKDSYPLVFFAVGIPLFLISSWCSFWISYIGVLRK